jgi:hypothetical protein
MKGDGRMMRRAFVSGAAALLIGVLGPGSVVAAGADEAAPPPRRNVVAHAAAEGMRGTYTMPDFVAVSEFFDGGGPVAESLADGTGRATSFAALPWPGENAVTAPGALSVVAGRSVPLAYPFYVSADHPTTPKATLADPTGTYSLSAAVDLGRAQARGAFGGGGSGSVAETAVVLDDGGITRVVARSSDAAVSIGDGVLTIARIVSVSETTLGPSDTAPVTRTTLVVEGARVAGQPVTIGPDGVRVASGAAPVPFGQGDASLNQLLAQSGISVRTMASGTPGRADVLVITSVHQVPGAATGTLVQRFGGASTEIVIGSAE